MEGKKRAKAHKHKCNRKTCNRKDMQLEEQKFMTRKKKSPVVSNRQQAE
uniref:Uncharacterized protein n=1 Tax=Aquilaria malaccensis TaxID=223753 RepID=A0A4Y6GMQ5_9ROSI|nr:hypothetical protein [Aquilaria malaccensis]